VQEFNEKMCSNSAYIFEILFDAAIIGKWFWSSFVPSPVELARKTITGSYRCGFYLNEGFESPIDILWTNEGEIGPGRLLGQILAPAIEGLFYLWAAETAFSGMQTISTMLYAKEFCGLDPNSTALANGRGAIGSGERTGDAVFYDVIQDPQNVYGEPGASVLVIPNRCVQTSAYGYIIAGAVPLTNVKVGIHVTGNPIEDGLIVADLGTIAAGSLRSFALEYTGEPLVGSFAVGFHCFSDNPTINFGAINVASWIISQNVECVDQSCKIWHGSGLIS
jgi:hypothetical protein